MENNNKNRDIIPDFHEDAPLPLPDKGDYTSMAMLVGISLTKPPQREIDKENSRILIGIGMKP